MMMQSTLLFHLIRGLAILSTLHAAPRRKGRQFRRDFSTPQLTSAESWSTQETDGELRGEVAGLDGVLATGVDTLSTSSLSVPGDSPILWSPSYNGKAKAKSVVSRAKDQEARKLKDGIKRCHQLQARDGSKHKRSGGAECEQEEEASPHLAQQDMSNDPALQDMPNTVGPNPNIFGGFPENDIWGNFELPSPATIDHLKMALKMNHHRPSYSEDQASDANDQLYSYEHHALPEYDILETPPFQHLLWQNAQLQQVMKAGGNGCPPGMGSCPPTNNKVTCENLNDVCAANAQHKPVDQPDYEAPCPDKILQLFGCGAPTEPPPQEKVEDEEAIPVKPPKEKPKKPEKPEKEDEAKKPKPKPIPLQITSEGGAKATENGLGSIASNAKMKVATALKELTNDINNIVEQEGRIAPDSVDAGLDQIMTHARNKPHEKHFITEAVHPKAFHAGEKTADGPDASHAYTERDSQHERAKSLPVTASLTVNDETSAAMPNATGDPAIEFSPETSVAMMTLIGNDLEQGLEQKLAAKDRYVSAPGSKVQSFSTLEESTRDSDKNHDGERATSIASLMQHDGRLQANDKAYLTTTFDTLNGNRQTNGESALQETAKHLEGLYDTVSSQLSLSETPHGQLGQSKLGTADFRSTDPLKAFSKQGNKGLQEIADILSITSDRAKSQKFLENLYNVDKPTSGETTASGTQPNPTANHQSGLGNGDKEGKAVEAGESPADIMARLNGETENEIQEGPSKPTWGPWTKCSATCGIGHTSRMLQCFDADQCASAQELFQTKPCRLAACPDPTGGRRLKSECLPLHNEFRRRHGAGPVAWSDELYKKAADIVDRIAGRSIAANNLAMYEQPGLNLAVVSLENPSNNRTETTPCKRAVETWYGEKINYNFDDPKLTTENRDFTQLVWKGTREVGIATSRSTDGKLAYVAAVYKPVGNVDSYYDMKKNALPLQNREDEKTLEFLDKLLVTKKRKKSNVLHETGPDKAQGPVGATEGLRSMRSKAAAKT